MTYFPSVKSGHLPAEIVTRKAGQIQELWSSMFHYPSLAEIACAGALASAGYLTSVSYFNLISMGFKDSVK